MTERPMIGVRVPQEWKADLETIAARKGQTVSQMLYDSIAQYLDREAVSSVNRFVEPVNHQATEVLSGQVLAVLTDLCQQVQALAGMETRVAETVTEQLQTALTGFTRPTETVSTETLTEKLQTALTAPVKPSIPHEPSESVAAQSPQHTKRVTLYNQEKALDAERRIKAAIAALKSAHNFPNGLTKRVNAIMPLAQCSRETLRKHKPLWHPAFDPPVPLAKQTFTITGAYKLLSEERGFTQSKPMFKQRLGRALLAGALPDDLAALGLVADFELRKRSNPKDHSIRWLSFKN